MGILKRAIKIVEQGNSESAKSSLLNQETSLPPITFYLYSSDNIPRVMIALNADDIALVNFKGLIANKTTSALFNKSRSPSSLLEERYSRTSSRSMAKGSRGD